MSSEQIGGTSLLSNLKNKIIYKANKLAYDPAANQYANNKQQTQEQQPQQQPQQSNNSQTTEDDTTDPNTFSVKRIVTNTTKKFSDTFGILLPSFLALMATMLITNEMIVYSIPIRIIFFIFILVICLFVPIYPIIIGGVYALKAMYGLYINTTRSEKEEKMSYLPTIFALLPIKLSEPTSTLGKALMYPFTYPKSEKGSQKLPIIMSKYENSLQKSFVDFDKYKSMPMFSKLVTKIHDYLEHLHDKPIQEPIVENNKNTN
jgi:hypothetical protein